VESLARLVSLRALIWLGRLEFAECALVGEPTCLFPLDLPISEGIDTVFLYLTHPEFRAAVILAFRVKERA